MGLLKKLLSTVVILQLMVVVFLISQKSWYKLQHINGYLHTISLKSQCYGQEMSLVNIVEHERSLEGLFNSMMENRWMSFQSSRHEPFVYKTYQKNRYLPLAWKPEDKNAPIVEELESKAKRLLGHRYVWGAVGPKCFDCSGFTMKVFREIGIKLPRVSRNQAKVGQLVKFNDLKPGDMVFFDTNRRRTGQVNHVGIYLEDGKFIHASSGSKRVVITSFDKKFYKDRFLWGRRVLKASMHYAFESLPNMKTVMLKSSLESFKPSLQLQ